MTMPTFRRRDMVYPEQPSPVVKSQNDPKHPSAPSKPCSLDARIRGHLGQGLRSLYADAIAQSPTPQMEDLLVRLAKAKV